MFTASRTGATSAACAARKAAFAETKGTPFYRLRITPATVTVVITLLAHGCPVQAIVAAFDLDERTVQAWHRRAGQHCQPVHAHLVEQPRDLGQVQADELRVKRQGGAGLDPLVAGRRAVPPA